MSLLKWRITDDKPGGNTLALAAINPPGGHDGYAVVSDGRVVAVCKYYGRAVELCGRFSAAFVCNKTACLKNGYIKPEAPAPAVLK